MNGEEHAQPDGHVLLARLTRIARSRPARSPGAMLATAAYGLLLAVGAAAAGAPQDAAAPGQGEKAEVPGFLADPNAAAYPRGAQLFGEICAKCHEHATGHAPAVYNLKLMTSASVYGALTTGAMRVQGKQLSVEDRKQVASFLGGGDVDHDAKLAPPACEGEAARFDFQQAPAFPSWGLTPANTRYVSSKGAGIDAQSVGKLHLKWALGFDGASRVRSEPALGGGAIFVGSQSGQVYALDRHTGCARWQFHAAAEVRSGIVLSPWTAGDVHAAPRVYFGDVVGNVYAVDALTGNLAWRQKADLHASATVTAAPALYKDRLYVTVSSYEEGAVGGTYECCTFRGSVAAYDAHTGKRLWKTYMTGKPEVRGRNPAGVKLRGPSGVGVWNTPSIDPKRGSLYVGTGNNYSSPATALSDAVVALDLGTGRIKWSYQGMAKDAWNPGCALKDPAVCPEEQGLDYDFGAAAILATGSDGHDLVVAGQKSGWAYGLDPDSGKLVWKSKVGRGGILAGIAWGMAVRGDTLFVPVSDVADGQTYQEAARPGLYALNLGTGHSVWSAPMTTSHCDGRGPACAPGIAAAVTATDDLVLTGGNDGQVRIYGADSGQVLWEYDTTQAATTVGGGTARGGSMSGAAGPIVHDGMLIIESGYSFTGRMPGNVMLVFGID